MNSSLDRWPKWLRWILLLPASIIGGFLAGSFVELINSLQAASARAPILYIAAFLGGLAGYWASFHISYCFAPSHKKVVVIVLGLIAVAGDLSVIHHIVQREGYIDLFRITGNVAACFVAWMKYVRRPPQQSQAKVTLNLGKPEE